MALPHLVVTLQAVGSDAARPEAPTGGGGAARAVVRVVLQDVGMADALAVPVGTVVVDLPDLPHAVDPDGPADELEVTLPVAVDALQPRGRYTLRAHLDRDGSGVLSAGDALTTTSVPVQPDDVASGRRVEVPLTQI